MCICVFAKQKSISIDYASESVWLDKDGLMEIVVDLLITNKGSESISELSCILPQQVIFTEGTRIPLKYKNKKLFQDITEDMVVKNSLYNNPNHERNFRIRTDEHAKNIIEFELSNPHHPSENMTYTGYYYGGNKIIRYQGISDAGHVILTKLKLSLLSVKLGEPLIKDEARWFRWKFLTLTGPLQITNRIQYRYNSLINRLFYDYSVIGPGTIYYSVKSRLESFRKSIDISSSKDINENLPRVYDAHRILYNELVDNCLAHPDTYVSINDWRVRFYNRQLDPFASMQVEGDISIAGAQPNFLLEYEDVYYEWKTGKLNIAEKLNDPINPRNDEGKFIIRFLTRYEPLCFRYFLHISFLLALLSLLISLLGFFINQH